MACFDVVCVDCSTTKRTITKHKIASTNEEMQLETEELHLLFWTANLIMAQRKVQAIN